MTQKSRGRWILMALVNVLVLAYVIFLYVQAQSADAQLFTKYAALVLMAILLVADIRSVLPTGRH